MPYTDKYTQPEPPVTAAQQEQITPNLPHSPTQVDQSDRIEAQISLLTQHIDYLKSKGIDVGHLLARINILKRIPDEIARNNEIEKHLNLFSKQIGEEILKVISVSKKDLKRSSATTNKGSSGILGTMGLGSTTPRSNDTPEVFEYPDKTQQQTIGDLTLFDIYLKLRESELGREGAALQNAIQHYSTQISQQPGLLKVDAFKKHLKAVDIAMSMLIRENTITLDGLEGLEDVNSILRDMASEQTTIQQTATTDLEEATQEIVDEIYMTQEEEEYMQALMESLGELDVRYIDLVDNALFDLQGHVDVISNATSEQIVKKYGKDSKFGIGDIRNAKNPTDPLRIIPQHEAGLLSILEGFGYDKNKTFLGENSYEDIETELGDYKKNPAVSSYLSIKGISDDQFDTFLSSLVFKESLEATFIYLQGELGKPGEEPLMIGGKLKTFPGSTPEEIRLNRDRFIAQLMAFYQGIKFEDVDAESVGSFFASIAEVPLWFFETTYTKMPFSENDGIETGLGIVGVTALIASNLLRPTQTRAGGRMSPSNTLGRITDNVRRISVEELRTIRATDIASLDGLDKDIKKRMDVIDMLKKQHPQYVDKIGKISDRILRVKSENIFYAELDRGISELNLGKHILKGLSRRLVGLASLFASAKNLTGLELKKPKWGGWDKLMPFQLSKGKFQAQLKNAYFQELRTSTVLGSGVKTEIEKNIGQYIKDENLDPDVVKAEVVKISGSLSEIEKTIKDNNALFQLADTNGGSIDLSIREQLNSRLQSIISDPDINLKGGDRMNMMKKIVEDFSKEVADVVKVLKKVDPSMKGVFASELIRGIEVPGYDGITDYLVKNSGDLQAVIGKIDSDDITKERLLSALKNTDTHGLDSKSLKALSNLLDAIPEAQDILIDSSRGSLTVNKSIISSYVSESAKGNKESASDVKTRVDALRNTVNQARANDLVDRIELEAELKGETLDPDVTRHISDIKSGVPTDFKSAIDDLNTEITSKNPAIVGMTKVNLAIESARADVALDAEARSYIRDVYKGRTSYDSSRTLNTYIHKILRGL